MSDETRTGKYQIKAILDLSRLSEDANRDPDTHKLVELFGDRYIKVAAVVGGDILDFAEIDPRKHKDQSSIPVELAFNYEPVKFKGVNIVVAPNLPVREFLGASSEKRRISPRQFKENVADIRKDKITVEVGLAKIWLAFCQTYTIRGRVVCRKFVRFDSIEQMPVFCDEPVPGAKVEAFDVDCWWYWWKKDFIKSAITDMNGYFEIKFRWCCLPWYPNLKQKWTPDLELLDTIREVFAQAKPPLPPPPKEALRSPVSFLEYMRQFDITGLGSKTESADLPNMLDAAPTLGKEASLSKVRLPMVPCSRLPCWPFRKSDCRPDVILKVTQECKGALEVIYEETRADTRWNIANDLYVTLLADCDKACSIPICDDLPPEDCIQFTKIGCLVDIPEICTESTSPIFGYYNGSTNVPCTSTNRIDRPFGGVLEIEGFGFVAAENSDFDYYKVQYAPYGTTSYTDIETLTIERYYWFNPPATTPPFTVRATFDATTYDAKDNLIKTVELWRKDWEAANPGQALFPTPTNRDMLVRWNTRNVPDDVYTLRILGYRKNNGGLDGPYPVVSCVDTSKEETMLLRLDNRQDGHPPSSASHPCGFGTVHSCSSEPDCDFVRVVKNDGLKGSKEINGCDMVKLKDTDTLTIYYDVGDEDGHLSHYCLSAHYAESQVFNIVNHCESATDKGSAPVSDSSGTYYPGPHYTQALTQGATRPHWYGGRFKVQLQGSDFISCAYLFRLRVWKRTTNGCWLIYGNRCEFSFCIEKV